MNILESKTSDIKIRNIADYIEQVFRIYRESRGSEAGIFFRGQANNEWDLLPSVLRNQGNENIDFTNEMSYLFEFKRQLPEECEGLDQFDTMVKAQHYGIPTRLLDFTTNPLVALYFACCDKNESNADGAVYVTIPQPVYYQDYPLVTIYLHFLFKFRNISHWTNREIELFNKSLLFNYNDIFYGELNPAEFLWKANPGENPLFISPRMTNERIKAQHGLFALYITPLVQKNNGSSSEFEFIFPSDPTQSKYPEYIKEKLIVPQSLKEKLLDELQILGISSSSLFPGLEPHARDIVNRYRYQK